MTARKTLSNPTPISYFIQKKVIDIVRTQLWGGRGGLPNAYKCVQGEGVFALSMHAFWPLKHLQFWVVLMEGNLKPVTSIEQFSLNFITFI